MPTKTDLIDVMICVNNPINGNYAGRLAGLDISDFIHLEPSVLPEPRCTVRDGSFSVHRHCVQTHGHQVWVGNRCWDSIRLTRADAAGLLAVLLRQTAGYTDNSDVPRFPVWSIGRAEGENTIALMERRNFGHELTADEILAAMESELTPTP